MEYFAAPADRSRQLARRKEIVVVFGVSYSNSVVRREPKNMQRVSQARALADGLWKHHEAANVEQDNKWELQISDCRQDRGSCRGIYLYDALAGL